MRLKPIVFVCAVISTWPCCFCFGSGWGGVVLFLLVTSALPILFFLPSNIALAVPLIVYSFIFIDLKFIAHDKELITADSVTHF